MFKKTNYASRVQGALALFTNAKNTLVKINEEVEKDNDKIQAEIQEREVVYQENKDLLAGNAKMINKINEFLG